MSANAVPIHISLRLWGGRDWEQPTKDPLSRDSIWQGNWNLQSNSIFLPDTRSVFMFLLANHPQKGKNTGENFKPGSSPSGFPVAGSSSWICTFRVRLSSSPWQEVLGQVRKTSSGEALARVPWPVEVIQNRSVNAHVQVLERDRVQVKASSLWGLYLMPKAKHNHFGRCTTKCVEHNSVQGSQYLCSWKLNSCLQRQRAWKQCWTVWTNNCGHFQGEDNTKDRSRQGINILVQQQDLHDFRENHTGSNVRCRWPSVKTGLHDFLYVPRT